MRRYHFWGDWVDVDTQAPFAPTPDLYEERRKLAEKAAKARWGK